MTILLTIVLLACLAGIAFCAYRARTRPEGLTPVVVLLVVMAVIAGTLRLCLHAKRTPAATTVGFHMAVGHKLGETLARQFPAGGEVLVLQYNFGKQPSLAAASQLKGLEKGFGRSGLRVAAVEPAFDPAKDKYPDELTRIPAESGIPDTMFLAALGKHRSVKAIVSFVGLPLDVESGKPASPPEGMPPMFLYSADARPHWAAWMKQGAIKAVLQPKPGGRPASEMSWRDVDKAIEESCIFVTPENLDAIMKSIEPGAKSAPPPAE